jgi:hypothetical protein
VHLHWGWAVPAALLLGAALVWWTQPPHESGDAGESAHPAAPDGARASGNDGGPRLYRWVDSHGVVNISTEKPHAGIHYTIVHVNPNQNVVPMKP